MALQIFDRIKERVQTSAGTGPLTLLGAPTGFKTFSSRLNISDTTYYCVEGPGGVFEIGVGTLTTSTTLARTTVLKSSNSDAAISIGDSGQYFVFITLAADKAVYKDGSGRIVSGAAGIIFSDASIQTTAATTPDLSAYAPLASPTFTGTPAAPTATSGTNTTQLATTAFVASAVGSIDLTSYALLPDTLPVAGTLLSYGGNRQLAAGGTVTHSGALSLENNALTCGGIKLNGSSSNNIERRTDVDMLMFQGLNSVYGVGIGSSGFRPGLVIPRLSKIYFSNDTQAATDEIELVRDSTSLFDVRCNNGMRVRNKANSADAALTCGAITASGLLKVRHPSLTVGNSGDAAEILLENGIGDTRFRFGFVGVNGSISSPISGITHLLFGRDTGNVTIPTGTLTCGAITASGTIRQAAEITYTPTGTTQTITLNDGNHQTLNLTSATGAVTVTLTVPTSSSAGTIIVNQHASVAKDLTWAVSSGTIRWMGTEPTWASDAANAVRIISWRWNGSIMYLAATEVGT